MEAFTGPAVTDRRLWIVVGKGGVGKTTVSVLWALWAADRGKSVLLVEVDGAGRAARLLGVEPAPIGVASPPVGNIAVMSVEGTAALAEYLRLVVPIRRLLDAVFASRIYQYFVAAAPGLKELMTIGKIWYEAEKVSPEGRPLWDVVIVDAPATGHSLQYLGMPAAAQRVFPSGLVGRESKRLVDLLQDPRRTAVHLVTTAEEMPVNETIEMYERLRSELRMPTGYLIVNRLHARRFATEALATLERRAEILRGRERALASGILDSAREETGWSSIHERYLCRLQEAVPLPMLRVPFLFVEEFGPAHLRTLVRAIDAQLAGERAQQPSTNGSTR